jgi:hypothetical protein
VYDGRVSKASFEGEGEIPEPFRGCLLRLVRTLALPAPEAPPIELRMPVNLLPG